MKWLMILVTLIFLSPWARATEISFDEGRLSASGISAGAYFAEQLVISHSTEFMGLGIFAGGPYFCSQGSAIFAFQDCLKSQGSDLSISNLKLAAERFASAGSIDRLAGLKTLRIYALSGANDPIVPTGLVSRGVELLEQLGVDPAQIKMDIDPVLGHGLPTVDFGNSCSEKQKAPFLNRCGFSGAEGLLNHLYGPLKARSESIENHFFKIKQASTIWANPYSISMADEAVVYVPGRCLLGKKCALHIAFHGCLQTQEDIGDDFYRKSGYVEVAEANDIIILFPQIVKNLILGNGYGCWDWWGYTSPTFATKYGPQIMVIEHIVDQFRAGLIPQGQKLIPKTSAADL
jgi:poly(3-hydroxybutyrate) depolymerase